MEKYANVLIVDESHKDACLTEATLKKSGIAEKVSCEGSPSEALLNLGNISRINPYDLPDLVFVEMRMTGMEPAEFLAKLSEIGDVVKDKCRVIVLSSAHHSVHKSVSEHPWVICCLEKPLNIPELKEILYKQQ